MRADKFYWLSLGTDFGRNTDLDSKHLTAVFEASIFPILLKRSLIDLWNGFDNRRDMICRVLESGLEVDQIWISRLYMEVAPLSENIKYYFSPTFRNEGFGIGRYNIKADKDIDPGRGVRISQTE